MWKKERNRRSYIIRKIENIGTAFIVLLLGIVLFEEILKYNATKYSFENNSWYVDIDTIKRTGSIRGSIVLSEYGKVAVNKFSTLVTGDSVYVVIVEGRFGGTYVADIYPADKYIYKQ